MRILVTGATGTVGRHVVDDLVAHGISVRAVSRRPQGAGLPDDAEALPGDLDEPASLASAFEGIDRVFLIAAGRTRQVVELARRCGVRRIVVLSSATAGFEPLPDSGAFHRSVEQAVEESGLEWTHLRPGMFAANLLDWAEAIRTEGVVRAPYNEARQAPVHERDIAAVAVAALIADDHIGQTYRLSGPESLRKAEQTAQLGQGIGRAVRFEALSPEQWRAYVSEHIPPVVVEFLLELWAQTVQHPEPVLAAVSEVLGRPARTVAEWARDHRSAFQ